MPHDSEVPSLKEGPGFFIQINFPLVISANEDTAAAIGFLKRQLLH